MGLPLAVAFAEAGHDVVGVDADQRRVTDGLAAGRSHVEDVTAEALQAVSDRLQTTTRYADLAKVDAIVIAVPTPLTENREPDLRPLIASGTSLAGVLQAGQLVVLESTTYPGTTRERLVPLLEESGLAAGRDFNVAFSPERVDPGRTDYTLRNTPKVVGGLTDACLERAVELYDQVCDEVVPVSDREAAELTKLLENVFRSVNIALVNELAMLCDRMGIDIWEVVDAAATKPYGFMRFEPGPGHGRPLPAGRPVLPGLEGARVRHADRVHRARGRGEPAHAVLLRGADRPRAQRPLQAGARLAGGDHRRVLQARRGRPARVAGAEDHAAAATSAAPSLVYHDDYVPELPELDLQQRAGALEAADCAVIVTAHPGLDVERVVREAPLVVDFRGVTRGIDGAQPGAAVSARRIGVVGLGYWGPNLARNFDGPPGRAGLALRRLAGAAGAPRRRAPRARAPPTTWTSCWPTTSSTPWPWPRRCPPTPSWPSGCCAAGKHCFVEKPLAQSVAEAERVVAAARERGRVLMVGPPARVPPRAWSSSRR